MIRLLGRGWAQAGQIVDDDLNRLLVNPLPPGVRLHAIIGAPRCCWPLITDLICKSPSSGPNAPSCTMHKTPN